MRIQKGVFVLLLIFNFLSLRSYVYADIWDLKFPLLFPTSTPKPTSFFIKKIPPLFFLPTNTPTITPSPTDAPTSTPAPTETPFPTPSIELSPNYSQSKIIDPIHKRNYYADSHRNSCFWHILSTVA